MTLRFEFEQAEIKSQLDWQLCQDINVFDGDMLVAKAEVEIITINKHRDAIKSYQALLALGATDWELPLNLYFKNQNLNAELCAQFAVKPEGKKACQHLLIEAISVHPDYQNKGIAKQLLAKLGETYSKAQSVWLIAMPISTFIDADECDEESDSTFYSAVISAESNEATSESVAQVFERLGFEKQTISPELLAEPLPYELLVTVPSRLS